VDLRKLKRKSVEQTSIGNRFSIETSRRRHIPFRGALRITEKKSRVGSARLPNGTITFVAIRYSALITINGIESALFGATQSPTAPAVSDQ
jgi:hypothetical protein